MLYTGGKRVSLSAKFIKVPIPVFQLVEVFGNQTGESGSNYSTKKRAVLRQSTNEEVDVIYI